MDNSTLLILIIGYSVGIISTILWLSKMDFGYAPFAVPFITYPIVTFLVIIVVSITDPTFEWFDHILYFFYGLFGYSLLCLGYFLVAKPKFKYWMVDAKVING